MLKKAMGRDDDSKKSHRAPENSFAAARWARCRAGSRGELFLADPRIRRADTDGLVTATTPLCSPPFDGVLSLPSDNGSGHHVGCASQALTAGHQMFGTC